MRKIIAESVQEHMLNESPMRRSGKMKRVNYKPSPSERLAKALYPMKTYGADDAQYRQRRLIDDLYHLGIKDVSTPAQLLKNPEFSELSHIHQKAVYRRVGLGKKTPNKAYVMEFLDAFFSTFYDRGHDSDPDSTLYAALDIKAALERGAISLTGINYARRRKLNDMIKSYDLKKTLTEEEYGFLVEMTRKEYESFVKKTLSDDYIFLKVKEMFVQSAQYSDNREDVKALANIDWTETMPDFAEFIKNKVLAGEYIPYREIKIDTEYRRSSNSNVVSSSFSTRYYYDVTIEFMGETFAYEDVQWSSSHYSGGY